MASMDHQTVVFASVFPVPSLSHTTPTPVATPDLAFTAPGSSFGSPHIANSGGTQHRAVRRNAAWSTATRFLSLQKKSLDVSRPTRRSKDVDEALSYLIVGEGTPQDGEESIPDWYASEVRLHFADHVRQRLLESWNEVSSLQNGMTAPRVLTSVAGDRFAECIVCS